MKITFLALTLFILCACGSPNQRSAQSVTNSRYIEGRQSIVEKARPQLERGGVKVTLAGENKDVMIFNSNSLSNFEMLQLLRDSLDDFRTAGFSRIELTDKSGETQTVDLTALDE